MDYDALERLVKLRDQGALSDGEFAEQKRIILAVDERAEQEQNFVSTTASSRSRLQIISATSFAVGLLAVVYSTFFYDNTISPIDALPVYSSVDESGSLEAKANAVGEIRDRFKRTMAGERIINLPRVETQRRIFSFGALLMILGAIGIIVPLASKRQ